MSPCLTFIQYNVNVLLSLRDTHPVAEVTEGRVKLERALGQLLHLVAEALEAALELVSQLPLRLLRREIVTVMHVLVLAEIRRDFPNLTKSDFNFTTMRTLENRTDLCVELDILLLLFPKHDWVLEIEVKEDDHFTVTRLEQGVLDVVVEDIHLVAPD